MRSIGSKIARMTTVGAVAITAALTMSGCGDDSQPLPETKVERFHRVCGEHGGFVVETRSPGLFSSGRIDCIRDNAVLYLPGFA